MQSNEAILVVLLMVLILAVVFQGKLFGQGPGQEESGDYPGPDYPGPDYPGPGYPGPGYPGPGYIRPPQTLQRSVENEQQREWLVGGGMDGPFAAPPPFDYNHSLVDLVATEGMKKQHSAWADEVGPKSQTAMKVDSIDEASTLSAYNGYGINAFRMASPPQNNPLMVTEHGPEDYAAQRTRPYSFNG